MTLLRRKWNLRFLLLGDRAQRVKFMIRDGGSDFTAAFDAVLADAGIRIVLCDVRTPRMNAIAERWIGGCRRTALRRQNRYPNRSTSTSTVSENRLMLVV